MGLSRKSKLTILILILFAFILAGCRTPEAVPEPEPTKVPTATATSTPTPEPTATPTPTVTPTSTPTPIPTLGVGSTSVRLVDAMKMVYVPSGCFSMGIELLGNYAYMGALFGTRYEKGVIASQAPEHSVCLDTYWIDQTEVTNRMYALCVDAGICKEPYSKASETREDYYSNPEFADFPVVSVTRKDAIAYCEWAGGRLPTEAEWEKAARGQDRRTYPWGELEASCDYANIHIYPSNKACVGDTVAVGSYPAGVSPYGALDMAGNVAEWVGDWYATNYYITSPEQNPTGPKWGDQQVLRGGGYSHFQNNARAGARIPFMPSWGIFPYMGFRCVLPVP